MLYLGTKVCGMQKYYSLGTDPKEFYAVSARSQVQLGYAQCLYQDQKYCQPNEVDS